MAAWWSVSTNFYVSLLVLLHTECCIPAFFARVVAHRMLYTSVLCLRCCAQNAVYQRSLLALLRTECCIPAFFACVVAHRMLYTSVLCSRCCAQNAVYQRFIYLYDNCRTTQSVFEKTDFLQSKVIFKW